SSDGTDSLIAVRFVDSQRGEAIDAQSDRYITADGGATWQRSGSLFQSPITTLDPRPSLGFTHIQLSGDVTKAEYTFVNDGIVQRVDSYGPRFICDPMTPSEEWVHFAAQVMSPFAYIVGSQGTIYASSDNGRYCTRLFTQTKDDLHGLYFSDANRGWVVGSNGAIFATTNAGVNWTKKSSGTTSQLNSINFRPDGLHGWIAGADGVVLATADGGETWVHQTQGREGIGGRYYRFPAPWYFLSLLAIGFVVLRRRVDPVVAPPEESVADVLVSDRPLERPGGDVLAFNSIARGMSRFLRNENTLPPLTIAITGEWGTGKSSLMNLLRTDLRSYKFRPVWFNAWHHQKEEYMLASLLENIKLQAVPRWWTMRGILFRGRLLLIRGWRHWLPLLLLLFFIYVMLVYRFGTAGSETTMNALIQNIVVAFKNPATAATTGSILTLIPLLAGIVTFITALWRGITAFGVKPASLLAGVSRGMSIRGLEAQTSFRQKFAVQFSDVTRALGQRSLLIFIDDLDRCRPDQVVETLEAVNFLTSSGECFVVLGMAREYVERCVGRAFKEVAEEMIDEVEKQGKTAEEVAREKRIEFARQYLDKLINIEVPVPAPKQTQSLALLIASTRDADIAQAMTRWQAFRVSCLNSTVRYWRAALVMLTIAGFFIVGWYLAHELGGGPASKTETQGVTASQQQQTQGQAQGPATGSSASGVNAQVNTANQRANLVQGGRSRVSPNILPALGLIGLIWVGATILTRRPGLVVKDSRRFVKALEIWHPLVYARQATPRATKRFMNHVRYLAMRQRRQSETQPLIEKVRCWLKVKLTGVPVNTHPEVNLDNDLQIIPDEILVALAAQESLDPVTVSALWKPMIAPVRDSRVVNVSDAMRRLFETAVEMHQAEFKNWDAIEKYRERFREMTRNVQVR
ncbi:MAG: hypothetical protein DMF69_15920, partial [Acidobacteria bacterium]